MRIIHARKRSLGPILALVAALAIPGSTFAASSSGGGDQTLTVQGTISISGVPTSIDFGSGGPGDTKSSNFSATILTNNPSGYRLDASNGQLLSGGDAIPRTAQSWSGVQGTGCNSSCHDGSGAMPAANGTVVTVGSRTIASNAAGDVWSITDTLGVPNVPPGTYAGLVSGGNGFSVSAITQ